MKSFRNHRWRQRGVALLAVLALITLVVVLLVAFLVVMMLDSKTTASYSQSIKAQEIALGGLEEITSDLKQEIAAGSVYNGTPSGASYSVTDPVTGQPVVAYIPAANSGGVSYSAEPARIGFPAVDFATDVDATGTYLPPTLLRVSRDGSDGFYQQTTPSSFSTYYPQMWAALPPARATTTSTTALSVNSRSIAVSRWNKPQIMNAASAPPAYFTANPPEWVYVGRSGSLNTKTGVAFTDADAAGGTLYADAAGANANAILGRYSYVMYDEGALLDANVAGADSTTVGSTTSPNAPFRNKAFLTFADLTQVPGLTQTALTSLVGWRNQGGVAAWGSFNSLATGADTIGFLTFFGPHNTGSASAYPTTSAATHNDNPFLSRQDLIDYCNNVAGSASPLPYLGTFSRAVNAASAVPVFNAPSASATVYQYAKNAENTSTTSPANGTPNRDLANVRFGGSGTSPITITHYKDDGTTTTYTVDPGSPLLQRRFSLAKIAWIGYNGPNASAFNSSLTAAQQAAAIQDCFGLVWDTSADPSNGNQPYNTWDYVGGVHDGYSTTSPPNIINTLAQVAALATPREPNFFELLKAGILNGSLGRDPGPVAINSTSAGVTGALFDSYSALPDAHLVQIGANIIDQATQDGYPTAIYFAQHNPATYPAPYYRLFDTAFGIKDLPYFYRVFPQQYTTTLTGNTTFPSVYGTCQGWFQPELWNPHQNPNSLNTAPANGRPSAFRVRAHGGAQFAWHQLATQLTPGSVGNDSTAPTNPFALINYEISSATGTYSANPSNSSVPSCIYFNDASGNVFREQPLMLTTSNTDTATTTTYSPQNLWQSSWTAEYVNPTANQFAGIWVGSDSNYNPEVNNPATGTLQPDNISHVCEYNATAPVPSGSPAYPTLALEYKDSSGNYHPYALMSRFIEVLGSNSVAPHVGTGPTGTSLNQHDDISTWCVANTGVPTRMDPRTDRFTATNLNPGGGVNPFDPTPSYCTYALTQVTTDYGPASSNPGRNAPIPAGTTPYFFYITGGTLYSGSVTLPSTYYLNTWLQNQTVTQNAAQAINPGFVSSSANNYSYYLDPDQVPTQGITVDAPRPGDGFRWNSSSSSRGNGVMLFHTSTANPAGYGTDTAPQRPVILNRPFRSVGEMGYAFRDVPFKSVDFWSQYSPDAALLDLFSVQDEPAVVAGQINPNHAPVTVLKAVLSEEALKEVDPTVNYTAAELKAVAPVIPTYVASNGPLRNRQDLVTAGSGLYSNSPSTATDLSDSIYTALATASSNKYWGNKSYGEAPIRALAPVTNIRTWNLLIDVIAQAGHMESNAKKLSNFVVDGEKRYWLHIAIDRYTGQVVDEQLEPVYE